MIFTNRQHSIFMIESAAGLNNIVNDFLAEDPETNFLDVHSGNHFGCTFKSAFLEMSLAVNTACIKISFSLSSKNVERFEVEIVNTVLGKHVSVIIVRE